MATGASDVTAVVHVTDFPVICRACMTRSNRPTSLLSVCSRLPDEDVPIESVVEELTAVQMRPDDGLPGNICAACANELQQFVGFIRKVRKSDRKLRQVFKKEGRSAKVEPEVVVVVEEERESEQVPEDEDDVAMGEVEYLDFDQIDWKTVQEDTSLKLALEEKREQPSVEPQEVVFEVKVEVDSETEFNGFEDIQEEQPVEEKPPVKKKNRQPRKKLPPVKRGLMPTKMKGRFVRTNGRFTDGPEIPEEMDEVEQETFRVIERQPGEFLCCRCFQFFPSKAERDEHSRSHAETQRNNGFKKHVCDVCNCRYTAMSTLKYHLQGAESQRVYECHRCLVRLVSKKKRWHHAHNHPQREVLANTIQAPVRVNPEYRPGVVCCASSCGQAFPTEEEMIAHAHDVHSQKKIDYEGPEYSHLPIQCPVCFRRFRNEVSMVTHQKRKYRKVFGQCSICGANMPSASKLAAHERVHRGERLFQCEICSKGFASKSLLKAHMLAHSSEKPFVCSVCGAGFARKTSHTNHERLHGEFMPYQCKYCPKAFRLKARLELHTRTHTGEKPYACRYCEKAFADHTNRQRHEMSHTGMKPYKCNECDKGFITKRLLAEHEASNHSATVIYSCSICLATFSTKTAYRRHTRSHGIEIDINDPRLD